MSATGTTNTSTTALLPAAFAEWEDLAREWAMPSLNQRYLRRLASTMDELRAFYDRVTPRLEEAIAHLDTFPYDDLPEQELNLLWLLASLSCIGFAVDVFNQPTVPDCGSGPHLPVTRDFYP